MIRTETWIHYVVHAKKKLLDKELSGGKKVKKD